MFQGIALLSIHRRWLWVFVQHALAAFVARLAAYIDMMYCRLSWKFTRNRSGHKSVFSCLVTYGGHQVFIISGIHEKAMCGNAIDAGFESWYTHTSFRTRRLFDPLVSSRFTHLTIVNGRGTACVGTVGAPATIVARLFSHLQRLVAFESSLLLSSFSLKSFLRPILLLPSTEQPPRWPTIDLSTWCTIQSPPPFPLQPHRQSTRHRSPKPLLGGSQHNLPSLESPPKSEIGSTNSNSKTSP